MKNGFLILLLSVCTALYSFAQSPFGSSTVEFTKNIYYLEMGGGGIISSMGYFNNEYDNLKSSLSIGQTQELALRIQYSYNKSFATRFSFRSQGVNFSNSDQFIMRANYLNLFIPFEYDIRNSDRRKKTAPSFVWFVGPWAAYRVGGFAESDILKRTQLTDDDIYKFDAGLEMGIGIRVPIFSFTSSGYITMKASVFHGAINSLPFQNNYSEMHKAEMVLPDDGYRFNRGIRLTLNYEMSLTRKPVTTFTAGGDGKRTYQRFVVP